MNETINTINKQIRKFESQRDIYILEQKKQKHATKKADKIKEQLYKILNENNVFKENIENDLEEFYCELLSLFKQHYNTTDKSYLKYEIDTFLDNIINDAQSYLTNIIKAIEGYIESLKELKKQYEAEK